MVQCAVAPVWCVVSGCVDLCGLVSGILSSTVYGCFFFLMIRRPPRSTQSRSSAASDVYKRQFLQWGSS